MPSILIASPKASTVDRIVAIVNQEPILASDLKGEVKLDDLIEQELVRQEAKKFGLDPSEQEIDQTIQNIIKHNKMTPKQFREALNKQGLEMKVYKAQLRDQLIKRNLIQQKVKNRVVSSGQYQVDLEQASYKTLKEAKDALKKPSKIKFTNLGVFSQGDLLPELSKIAFSLREKEISKPIESRGGFVLIRVQKRIESPLEKVDRKRYDQEIENAFKRYVKELRASAYIERK
ncbi:MAG: SurA N-terminal domain-containing protein [Deltaproteobacteria bacterium]|nr:SurA N-terminal domain-containing protein [Deltaproteobacteria bacterium]